MASAPFITLRDFLSTRMRMSHIYQPLMIRTLLTHGGRASIRQIASMCLGKDVSQLEYYEEITKNMPGKVLARHGIVMRDGNAFHCSPTLPLSSPTRWTNCCACARRSWTNTWTGEVPLSSHIVALP